MYSFSMSKASAKTNKSEIRLRYRLCVPPCPRYITSGIHTVCVVCLGGKNAELAHFAPGRLSLRREPSPAFLHSWSSQLDLVEGMEMGECLSSSSPARSTALSLESEAHSAVSFPPGEQAWRFSYLPPRRLMWRA